MCCVDEKSSYKKRNEIEQLGNCREIAREIEDQLEYPGQVKVTVIRESRSVDVARNHTAVQNGNGEGVPADPADSPIQAA